MEAGEETLECQNVSANCREVVGGVEVINDSVHRFVC